MGKKKKRKFWVKLVAAKAGDWIKDIFQDKDKLEDVCELCLNIVLAIVRSGVFPPGAPLLLFEKQLKELVDQIDGKDD